MPSRFISCLALTAALVCASCGGSPNGSSNGDVVPGATRIGWDQTADDATELAGLHFVIYIDNTRTELPNASCSGPAGSAGFSCEATLPAMSSGQHTIQLASYVVGDVLLESPKSAPLTITVAGGGSVTAGSVTASGVTAEAEAVTPRVAAPSSVRDAVTSDGVKLHTAVVAAVVQPTALAIAGDGTLLVGDRAGTLRVLRDGTTTETALGGGAVLAVALDASFARSHLLYVLDTVDGQPATFRLARYRELDGRLGERAVLLDGVPARPDAPAGALAFGADGRLYLALDDAGDPQTATRPSSYNGKVMRLTADGRTPGDQPAATPTYAANIQAPRSLVWDGPSASLWLADAGASRAVRLRTSNRRTAAKTYRLPQGPASIAVYRGQLMPALAGDLLVASIDDAPSILRVRMGGGDTVSATEPLTLLGSGSIRAVTVAPDGAIYALTDDAVLRIAPVR